MTRGFSWSPSSLSIAELVLARPDERLGAAPLARDGGWSTAQAASVLGMFDAQGWTVKRGPARGAGAYRRILDADGMLSAWSVALAAQTRDTRIAHRAARDVMGLLTGDLRTALDEGSRWAVSGWAGLELTAPRIVNLATRHDGVPVVSAPRLYADLCSFDARGQDAADHVKALLIDPLHPTRMAGQPIE